MTAETAEEILKQTKNFTHRYSITGRGEPLLCKNLYEILTVFRIHDVSFNLTTNGDHLDKHIYELDAILNLKEDSNKIKVTVNCYDGKKQKAERYEKYNQYKKLNFTNSREDIPDGSIYKDRMKRGKFSNRGGTLPWSYNSNIKKPCYILLYKTMVDWNGDVQLCCHDWKHLKTFGNIHDKPFHEIWLSKEMMNYRKKLSVENGRQSFIECMNCDAAQEWDYQLEQFESLTSQYSSQLFDPHS